MRKKRKEMQMKAQVVLTPAESKKLIAKSIARMEKHWVHEGALDCVRSR